MNNVDIALLVLRITFGVSMSLHGLNKVRGNGLAGTTGWFSSIGMKWPRAQALTASVTEIGSGVLLAVGFLQPLACIAFIALMLVAIVTVHWKVGYFIFLPNGGWEYCASIISVATALGLLGPGKYSVDNALDISQNFGCWVLPIGIAMAVCHLTISYRRIQSK